MSSNASIAIRVSNISKAYQIYATPSDRLKQSFVSRWRRLLRQPAKMFYREFWALKPISFSVHKGETLGVIGRNGSGKSTLLQIICGTLSPTGGTVETNGRIAALLELGAGFNHELTGRENVYINGAVLGLSPQEITDRFDSIMAFADIGDFIDQPVKTYSSGMYVRLAFAVQAQIDPDILVVDEALAVGDARFQAKCFARLKALKQNGTCIILVTHDSEQIVRHCDRALLMEQGEMLMLGDPKPVVNRYLDTALSVERDDFEPAGDIELVEAQHITTPDTEMFSKRPGYNPHEYRWGNGDASIIDCEIAGAGNALHFAGNQQVQLTLKVKFHKPVAKPTFALSVATKDGITVFGANSRDLSDAVVPAMKDGVLTARFTIDLRLATGEYLFSFSVSEDDGARLIPLDRRYDSLLFMVNNPLSMRGFCDLSPRCQIDAA